MWALARGCRGPSLLGVFGQRGTYITVLSTHLTSAARREFFDGSREQWFVLAAARFKWRAFVASIVI